MLPELIFVLCQYSYAAILNPKRRESQRKRRVACIQRINCSEIGLSLWNVGIGIAIAVWGTPYSTPRERRFYILVTALTWLALLWLHRPTHVGTI